MREVISAGLTGNNRSHSPSSYVQAGGPGRLVSYVNLRERIAWKLIQEETLQFYRSHGFRRLVDLAYHMVDRNEELAQHIHLFLRRHNKNSLYQTESAQQATIDKPQEWDFMWYSHLCSSVTHNGRPNELGVQLSIGSWRSQTEARIDGSWS